MPSGQHEELPGLRTVGKEQAGGPLVVGRIGVADGKAERGGERFDEAGGRVSRDGGPVQSRIEPGLGLANFDVNVEDTAGLEDRTAFNGCLDATFGGERAGGDSYEDDGKRGRLVIDENSNGRHGVLLDPLRLKNTRHGRTDGLLPEGGENVRTERKQLLGLEGGPGTSRLHPDIDAGASDETGFGWQPVVVVGRFDVRGNVRSIESHVGHDVVVE